MSKGSFHVEQTTEYERLTACPLCGGPIRENGLQPQDHLVSQERFFLTECLHCGFCQTNPRPTPDRIGSYYESPDYISHTGTPNDLTSRIYRWVRKRAIAGKYQLIHKHLPHGTVLDVGCGTGEFLAYLGSRGYRTQGVEPSTPARAQAIANHGLDILPQLESIPAQEQFDVITLWHVLEHVHDVRDTIKKLHARIRPGGLLIVAVPDRESWDATHYGADWAAYDVPRHLSHFRRADIARALDLHGFRLMETRGMWFDAPYVSQLSERHRGAGPLAALLKGAFFGLLSNAVAATTSRPTSSSLFVAQKT